MAIRFPVPARLRTMKIAAASMLLRRMRHDARGNVFMLMGFAILPLVMATGVGIDYSQAARLRTKLNAAADAAALAAVTKPMMARDNPTAKTKAENVFNAQAAGLAGVSGAPTVSVVVTSSGVGNLTRTATVTWSAASINSFGGILGRDTIPIGGVAVSTSTIAPDIDFYVMLDTSPSMLLPSTTAGINTMTAKTGGCAFACHQTSRSSDVVTDGGVTVDYYTYARNHSVPLRIDAAKDAIADLADTAQIYATANSANYRMAFATFDWQYQNYIASPGTLSAVRTQANAADAVIYCSNNNRVCGVSDNDQGSNFTTAFNGALANMPTVPGNGSRIGGDTPQAMLFIVTDGMRDEANGGRQMGPIPTAQCTTIKNRGIKIAILYTEYLASAASDSWSITNVRNPYLSPTDNISPALTTCASPGLMYKVTTDDDVSAALAALFKKAIESARLSQ